MIGRTAIVSITHLKDLLKILSDLKVESIAHHCSLFESCDSKKQIIEGDARPLS